MLCYHKLKVTKALLVLYFKDCCVDILLGQLVIGLVPVRLFGIGVDFNIALLVQYRYLGQTNNECLMLG